MGDAPGRGTIDGPSVRGWERHLGRVVDPQALRKELARGSLAEAFRATALARGDRAALKIDGRWATHGELDRRAARAAAWLRSAGVGVGDRVMLRGSATLGFVVAYLATLRLGAVPVPLGAALTSGELRAMADEALPVLRLAHEPSSDETAFSEIAVASAQMEGVDPVALGPDAVAFLAFTSGTTGRPKSVPLSHANLLASVRAAMLAWRWTDADVLVHALPLSHQHGLGGLHATLLAGSRMVLHSRFEPDVLAKSIAADRATVLFAVPTMYERMTGAEGIRRASMFSLRLAICGSSPLSPALAERVVGLFGELPLERYGLTESGLDVSNLYEEPRRPGAVGLPLPGLEMIVVDERGSPLPAGTEGEILMRGPQVFRGYAGELPEEPPAFYPEGWFRTGDVGRVNPEDGFLSLVGRTKDLIITGGLNVHPREVEIALEEYAGVAKAAVIGVPSERWGEEVTAFVVPAPGRRPDPLDCIAHARSRLAAYKCPKRVVVVNDLPVNAMGKVMRAELRATWLAAEGSA